MKWNTQKEIMWACQAPSGALPPCAFYHPTELATHISVLWLPERTFCEYTSAMNIFVTQNVFDSLNLKDFQELNYSNKNNGGGNQIKLLWLLINSLLSKQGCLVGVLFLRITRTPSSKGRSIPWSCAIISALITAGALWRTLTAHSFQKAKHKAQTC